MAQNFDVPALKKQWVLDAQWTDLPEEVEQVVKEIWRWREFGNDNYMYRTTPEELKSFMTDAYDIQTEEWRWGATPEEQLGWVKKPLNFTPLIKYLKGKGVGNKEEVIIHWWW